MKDNIALKLENDTRDFPASMEETLLKILRDNQDTEYGKRYDFAHIHSAEEYRKKVPITTYEDYREYIGRMLEKGEKNVTMAYPIRYWMISSGTTGRKKYIPMTDTAVELFERCAYEYPDEILKRYYRRKGLELTSEELMGRVFLLNEIHYEHMDNGCKSLILTSSAFVHWLEDGIFPYGKYTSPHSVLFPKYEMDVTYLKLRYALADENVTGIEGAYVHQVLNTLFYLEQNWELLVNDLAAGTISSSVHIPDVIRRELEPGLRPMPERAKQLRAEFEKGFDTPIVQRIWKKLKYVMAISGAAFDAYMQKLYRYIGTVPFHCFGFGASEGAFATAVDVERPGEYVMTAELGFFEFVPQDQGDALNVCSMEELQVGKKYELIHTGYAGLYRYRMGDVLEVTGFYNTAPIFKFCYRKAQCINIAGEKMDLEKVSRAVKEFSDTCHMDIGHFCVYPDTNAIPARYIVLLEAPHAEKPDLSEEEATSMMDALLGKHNMDYKDCRNLKEIGDLAVHFMKNGTSERYKEHLQQQGVEVGQYKPVRIIDTEEKKKFFFGEIIS